MALVENSAKASCIHTHLLVYTGDRHNAHSLKPSGRSPMKNIIIRVTSYAVAVVVCLGASIVAIVSGSIIIALAIIIVVAVIIVRCLRENAVLFC